MTAPQPSPGLGEFGLDLDKAREAVTELEKVYEQLSQLLAESRRVSRTSRTAHDAVSEEAFQLLSQMADGAAGSLAAAVEAGMAHVEGLLDQMRIDIQVQEQVEAAGVSEIGRA